MPSRAATTTEYIDTRMLRRTTTTLFLVVLMARCGVAAAGIFDRAPSSSSAPRLRGGSAPTTTTVMDNPLFCRSVIAIAMTLDPDHNRENASRSHRREEGEVVEEEGGETFLCEHNDGSTSPLHGTDEQMNELRGLLDGGGFVSAEMTVEVEGDTDADNDAEAGEGVEIIAAMPIFAAARTSAVAAAQTGGATLKPGRVKVRQETTARGGTDDSGRNRRQRRMATYGGQKVVLVVRVTDQAGQAVPEDAAAVSDKVFGTYGDDATMASQFDACSQGKMTITNEYPDDEFDTSALSAPGVLDISVNVVLNGTDRYAIRSAVTAEVESRLGLTLPGPFDHVMYVLAGCWESNDCGWAAYAYVNGWMSVYQGRYYKYPAVQMHEIGHNLNLAHSGGMDGRTYTDHTCLMGNPLYQDDVGGMCYNAAKNYQISAADEGGWYADRDTDVQTWDLVNDGDGGGSVWSGQIVGVAEYGINPRGRPIVLKLESGTETDLYLGFNHATGPTRDVREARDEVTVIEVGGEGMGYAKSRLKATLKEGESYTYANWTGTGEDLVVLAREIDTTSVPGYADVLVSFDGSPTLSPTSAPTKNPTMPPTQNPIVSPTASPSRSPTSRPPTFLPTRTPSTSPSLSPTRIPTSSPTTVPTASPTFSPTKTPTIAPSLLPTRIPTSAPTKVPTASPTFSPTKTPTIAPSLSPTRIPTSAPTKSPTASPISPPTTSPTLLPTSPPTQNPANSPAAPPRTMSTVPDLAYNSGSNGNAFEVRALRDVTIIAFQINALRAGPGGSVKIYTRPGGYDGHLGSVDGWELVLNHDSVDMGLRGAPTSVGRLDRGVVVAEGDVQSFYVHSPQSMVYLNPKSGDTVGNEFAVDDSLVFYEGVGVRGEFGSIYSPRIFSGIIEYDVGAAAPPSKSATPSQSPTDSCGNGVCDTGETANACPADCAARTLATLFDANSTAHGSMFDVRALSHDVYVTGLDINANAEGGSGAVKVFSRAGSYAGHEGGQGGWDLVYDRTNVEENEQDQVTELGDFGEGAVRIPAGTVRSFYVWAEYMLAYTKGSVTGEEFARDDSVVFYEGVGILDYFGHVYPARVWNGNIHYYTTR